MARRKNRPEAIQEKTLLSTRLRDVRAELYGERGGSEMARRLGIPVRTWYNYESGVTVPAEVLLRFLELTSVEPAWLLHGRGPKFRHTRVDAASTEQVRDLLRTALDQLSQRESPEPASTAERDKPREGESAEVVLVRVDETVNRGEPGGRRPHFLAARREHVGPPEAPYRCLRNEGDAMVPVLADGAYVAYSEAEEPLESLAGSLVVAWLDGRPSVRWFELAGRYGVLRAENTQVANATMLVDLEDEGAATPLIRRVLWTNTPHP